MQVERVFRTCSELQSVETARSQSGCYLLAFAESKSIRPATWRRSRCCGHIVHLHLQLALLLLQLLLDPLRGCQSAPQLSHTLSACFFLSVAAPWPHAAGWPPPGPCAVSGTRPPASCSSRSGRRVAPLQPASSRSLISSSSRERSALLLNLASERVFCFHLLFQFFSAGLEGSLGQQGHGGLGSSPTLGRIWWGRLGVGFISQEYIITLNPWKKTWPQSKCPSVGEWSDQPVVRGPEVVRCPLRSTMDSSAGYIAT